MTAASVVFLVIVLSADEKVPAGGISRRAEGGPSPAGSTPRSAAAPAAAWSGLRHPFVEIAILWL